MSSTKNAEDASPQSEKEARRGLYGLLDRAVASAETPSGHLVLGLLAPLVALIINTRRVWAFTVDDSYISFRYARNFASGLGLVYNPGERIEGYTNFLWTVLLAGGIRVGADPDLLAKVMGSLSACGSLGLLYWLANRFKPFALMPCVATWLFASSIISLGYSVFGLETSFFVFLVLAGMAQMFRETDRGQGFWGSGALFALAGLTRPEAPMYLGILMLFLGRRFFTRQNIARGLVFAVPVAIHMLFRHSYYGTWLPNTFGAKTGDLSGQITAGRGYLAGYLAHAGPVLWLALGGFAIGIAKKRAELAAVGALALAVLGYVTLVGGDWMPYYRFLAPFEPFCFLLVDLAGRSVIDARDRSSTLALAAFALFVVIQRNNAFTEARAKIIKDEKVFWDSASGGVADWFKEHDVAGSVAIADIGYVGYATDYPVVDLLGLVDPVISKLPGGYTHKTGSGYVERVFDVKPHYFVLVGSQNSCKSLPFAAQSRLYRDARFQANYVIAGQIKHSKNGLWCIYERHEGKGMGEAPRAVIPRGARPLPVVAPGAKSAD